MAKDIIFDRNTEEKHLKVNQIFESNLSYLTNLYVIKDLSHLIMGLLVPPGPQVQRKLTYVRQLVASLPDILSETKNMAYNKTEV